MNDDTDRCPATNRNGEPCGHPTGWGTDTTEGPCKFHGGATDNRGKKNGNYKHGAFSKYLREDLTDEEVEAIDDVVDRLEDPQEANTVVRELIGDALAKYKRSGDVRFLKEIRQLLGDFNIADATDHVEHDLGDGAEILFGESEGES